jgi:hypothetical protein
MSIFSADQHDGFRSSGEYARKDGNKAISEEKDSLLSYQDKLDALAASIGTTKYVLLLSKRLAKGDKVSHFAGRIVVKGEYSEIETSQEFVDQATAMLPLLAELVWPKA